MWLSGKESACQAGEVKDVGLILGREDPQRRKWQPTPVFLPEKVPWTEEPGRLQFTGSQKVEYNLVTKQEIYILTYLK